MAVLSGGWPNQTLEFSLHASLSLRLPHASRFSKRGNHGPRTNHFRKYKSRSLVGRLNRRHRGLSYPPFEPAKGGASLCDGSNRSEDKDGREVPAPWQRAPGNGAPELFLGYYPRPLAFLPEEASAALAAGFFLPSISARLAFNADMRSTTGASFLGFSTS